MLVLMLWTKGLLWIRIFLRAHGSLVSEVYYMHLQLFLLSQPPMSLREFWHYR